MNEIRGKKSDEDEFSQINQMLLSWNVPKELLNASVSWGVNNIGALVFAVVVKRMKIIDHDRIAKQLR